MFDSGLNNVCSFPCELEPVFLNCGPKNIALGLNNHAWLYSAVDGRLQRKLQYVASVDAITLNQHHVAALVDGKVYLQLVRTESESLSLLVTLSCKYLLPVSVCTDFR